MCSPLCHIIHATIADWQRGSRMTFTLLTTSRNLSLSLSTPQPLSQHDDDDATRHDDDGERRETRNESFRRFLFPSCPYTSSSSSLRCCRSFAHVGLSQRASAHTGTVSAWCARALGGRYVHVSPSAHHFADPCMTLPAGRGIFVRTHSHSTAKLDFPIDTK